MSLIPGLVSVSFRDQTVDTIIAEAHKCGLSSIEWGGDIHVPAGEYAAAEDVGKKTRLSRLIVSAYGSYYRLGQQADFTPVLKTAACLGAPLIRVWGGIKSPDELTKDEYTRLVSDAQKISEAAAEHEIKIGIEYHNNTVTENRHRAKEFMKDVAHDNFYYYWQPNQFHSLDENINSIKDLLYRTVAVHVFHWIGNSRYPLDEGAEHWSEYIKILRQSNRDISLSLEFMHDDKLSTLDSAARALRSWI